MAKILIVEDDPELTCLIRSCLVSDHYQVESVVDGNEAIASLRAYSYDVVLLDWGLPGMSGLDICKKFRDVGGTTPILMITARDQVSEKELGLDTGADDYLAKPFDMKELSARIRALLRRSSGHFAAQQALQFGTIILEPQNFAVTVDGADVSLSSKEFAILELMMRHPRQMFSVENLISRVWRSEENPSAEGVRQHIMNLRRKIASSTSSATIHTVRGVGYKLDM